MREKINNIWGNFSVLDAIFKIVTKKYNFFKHKQEYSFNDWLGTLWADLIF